MEGYSLSQRDKAFAEYLAQRTADKLQTLSPELFALLGKHSWDWYVNLPGGYEVPSLRIHYHAPSMIEFEWRLASGIGVERQFFHKQSE